MKNIQLFAMTVILAGCAGGPPKVVVTNPAAAPSTVPEVPVSTDGIRTGETVKKYVSGRYTDPNTPDVMHEGHEIYRLEDSSFWDLRPNQPTQVTLGPTTAVSDPATMPNALSAEAEAELVRMKAYGQAMAEQNEAMKKQMELTITQARQYASTQAQLQSTQKQVELLKEDNANLKEKVQTIEAKKEESETTTKTKAWWDIFTPPAGNKDAAKDKPDELSKLKLRI